jgi:glycine/D-amino acid oxidase-like deaminating enzyme
VEVDHLIIGQGICGTFLSWYLQKANRSFVIIDYLSPDSASHVAAGIINPVTGRRIVKTWMIDEVMPFAKECYEQLGSDLKVSLIEQKNIIDFFPTPQMRIAFHNRYTEDIQYLNLPHDQAQWRSHFHDDFGFGEIGPCYLVNVSKLIDTYRASVSSHLQEQWFDIDKLRIEDHHVRYNNIIAGSIIFCDGVSGSNNRYFKRLPFAPNKGEVLWIECADLPTNNIFKSGINLVPWSQNVFWVGSSYEWEFDNSLPSQSYREKITAHLRRWLKVPFEVVDHKASLRPATLERRPFVGFHPLYPQIGILNGMGTKGCSLAPFFANQFVSHIVEGTPIQPDADIKRFKNILTKNN